MKGLKMIVKSNVITKKEFEYSYSKIGKDSPSSFFIESVIDDIVSGTKADLICFVHSSIETNMDIFKVFFIVHNEDEEYSTLNFIGEFTWSSHIVSMKIRLALNMVMHLVHDWLVAVGIGAEMGLEPINEFPLEEIGSEEMAHIYAEYED